MSTFLFDLNGVVKALTLAEEFIGDGVSWTPGNVKQRALVSRLPVAQADLERIPELTGFAALTAEPINRALQEAGHDIQLSPWPEAPGRFGTVALLKVGVRWLVPGSRRDGSGAPLRLAGRPAFSLTSAKQRVAFGESAAGGEPVVILPTQSGDTVYLQRSDEPPADWVELYDRAQALVATPPGNSRYNAVVVPMVDADRETDVEWLLGLAAGGFLVAQALQQVKFGMNHLGASAKSGTAVMLERGAPKYYEIDGPFLAVIARPGVGVPIFAGYLADEVFADPGELDA